MLRITYFVLAIGLASCASPSKALEKGQNKKAMRLAKSDLKKNKNIEENIAILNEASNNEIDFILANNESKVASPEVKNWIKAQNNYYSLLENIGEANQITGGEVAQPYDRLCEVKTDLDFKIVEHYYDEGENHLAEYHYSDDKSKARSAYGFYHNAEEYGGDKYYQDIQDKKDYCVEHGRVYYRAYDYSPSNNIFLQPVPWNSDREADCVFNSSRSGYSSSQTRSTSQKTYSKKVEVGQEEIKDTSGNITYKTIYDKVYAYEDITEIKVTLRTNTWVNVENQTGHCHIRSWSFSDEVSDSFEEVRFSGDIRAYPAGANDQTGEPAFFRSNLEDELDRDVRRELGI